MFDPTRRQVLRAAGLAAPSAVGSLLLARRVRADAEGPVPDRVTSAGYVYLAPAEVAFVDAALDRLIPTDQLGAGARASGGTLFIDRQLAGPYGRAERWYMDGPWRSGTPEQGYQLKLTPAALYRAAIRDIDEHCRHSFGGRAFAQLEPARQDEVLHALEAGDMELPNASSKDFFHMLLRNAQEGFLADPLYGGNRDFAGWKLIGFPGPRYNYRPDIERYGQRYDRPTVGLLGREGDPLKNG